MRIGAIVQARTSSTRLHGKIYRELPTGSGVTVLQQVIRRLQRSKSLEEIIIAAPVGKIDDRIEQIALSEGVKCFRGSENDVLERYYKAAEKYKLDVIVRVTSDCPCIDYQVIDFLTGEHISSGADFTSNASMTYPHGLEAEVWNFAALKTVYEKAKDSNDREQVSDYVFKSRPGEFKVKLIKAPKELTFPDIRLTIDVEKDYALLCAVFDNLYEENNFFVTRDIIKLFRSNKDLKMVNASVADHTIEVMKKYNQK